MGSLHGDGRGYKLLYVEDDAVTVHLFQKIIERKYPHLQLLIAENGAVGLEKFTEEHPEIVLADLNMPIMNGIEMAQQIKTIDAEAIIIAVTTNIAPQSLQSAIEIGIRHYLLKPVKREKLFAVIDQSIEELNLKRRVKEQDEQLRKRKEQLSIAQKITHLGSWEWDIARGKTTWSDELYRIFGLEPAATPATYKGFLERVHPEDREAVKRIVQNALQQRQSVLGYHCRILRPDGSIRTVHGQGEVILDASGKLVSIVGTCHDVTETSKLEEMIKHQALHDPLTDLPNRQLFMDFLSRDLSQARRDRKKLALLFLDLNGFKQVNDTLGHSCGDLLLQEVAHRLRNCIRESDTVARIGGDEFTVLMPDLVHTEDIGVVLSKILGVFNKPFMLDDISVDSSTSIGISMFPDDGKSSEELIKKADLAMYEAKNSGDKFYQFYNAEINSRTMKRQKTEEFLRESVGKEQLQLLFQPLVCNETRSIIGAEALLRWRHPEQGLLAPEQFLTIAEESGAIIPIGEWVIRQACQQGQHWNQRGYPLTISVNLSNRQFHQADFIAKTAKILTETGIKPQQLEFDVTEKTIMTDPDYSLRSTESLAKIGVTLAIDNFGCGSSSLSWIKKMHPHRLKIDKSLIHKMLSEDDDLAVVNAVIALSHNLKMEVVANGVETREQLAAIRQSGCDQLQGYVISAPLNAARFERLVANF